MLIVSQLNLGKEIPYFRVDLALEKDSIHAESPQSLQDVSLGLKFNLVSRIRQGGGLGRRFLGAITTRHLDGGGINLPESIGEIYGIPAHTIFENIKLARPKQICRHQQSCSRRQGIGWDLHRENSYQRILTSFPAFGAEELHRRSAGEPTLCFLFQFIFASGFIGSQSIQAALQGLSAFKLCRDSPLQGA